MANVATWWWAVGEQDQLDWERWEETSYGRDLGGHPRQDGPLESHCQELGKAREHPDGTS